MGTTGSTGLSGGPCYGNHWVSRALWWTLLWEPLGLQGSLVDLVMGTTGSPGLSGGPCYRNLWQTLL